MIRIAASTGRIALVAVADASSGDGLGDEDGAATLGAADADALGGVEGGADAAA